MASSQVTLNKWVTFHRPVEVEPALAVAALVVRHDEEAVDVLQPVEVERPVALDSIADNGVVRVTARRSGGEGVLTFTDDGCGMTEDVRAHLFEPFYTKRADGSGTGLGLTITHRIIDEHQGSIRAFSQGPGHGSKLIVCLPMVKDEEERLSRAA